MKNYFKDIKNFSDLIKNFMADCSNNYIFYINQFFLFLIDIIRMIMF
jgi:hypothetical protein